MLIDNDKFIGLLVDNSGIEKEKVEKYLEELVSDIKTAFDEDEGYEVEGFGIFSKLGANILFIPSDELETEINYKYVGMEPIELPRGGSEVVDTEDTEEPIQGILDAESQEEESEEEYEDPFAELMGELDEEANEETDDVILDFLDDEDPETKEAIKAINDTIKTHNDQIINEADKDKLDLDEEEVKESLEELLSGDANLEAKDEEIEMPGPDKWGIDAHKEDDQEDAFSGLLGEAAAESELIDEDDIFASDEEQKEAVESEEGKSEEDTEEGIDFSALEDDITEDEDFDDPFEELEEEKEQEEDFVPVVTNVSSEKTSEESVLENETTDTEKETNNKTKHPKSPSDKKQSSPVFLYMILGLLILAGTGYTLAYFGVVNIDGVTPDKYKAQVAQVSPPVNQPQNELPQTTLPDVENPANTVPEPANSVEKSSNTTNAATENTTEKPVQSAVKQNDIAPLVADEKASVDGGIISPVNIQPDAEPYGLKGTATENGNNGYTIVLYTLSRKAGADVQFKTLSKAGYRVITKEIPSETYGVLYRVSIGQFKSLADAAIAAEKVDPDILGNYIITKI